MVFEKSNPCGHSCSITTSSQQLTYLLQEVPGNWPRGFKQYFFNEGFGIGTGTGNGTKLSCNGGNIGPVVGKYGGGAVGRIVTNSGLTTNTGFSGGTGFTGGRGFAGEAGFTGGRGFIGKTGFIGGTGYTGCIGVSASGIQLPFDVELG